MLHKHMYIVYILCISVISIARHVLQHGEHYHLLKPLVDPYRIYGVNHSKMEGIFKFHSQQYNNITYSYLCI